MNDKERPERLALLVTCWTATSAGREFSDRSVEVTVAVTSSIPMAWFRLACATLAETWTGFGNPTAGHIALAAMAEAGFVEYEEALEDRLGCSYRRTVKPNPRDVTWWPVHPCRAPQGPISASNHRSKVIPWIDVPCSWPQGTIERVDASEEAHSFPFLVEAGR